MTKIGIWRYPLNQVQGSRKYYLSYTGILCIQNCPMERVCCNFTKNAPKVSKFDFWATLCSKQSPTWETDVMLWEMSVYIIHIVLASNVTTCLLNLELWRYTFRHTMVRIHILCQKCDNMFTEPGTMNVHIHKWCQQLRGSGGKTN